MRAVERGPVPIKPLPVVGDSLQSLENAKPGAVALPAGKAVMTGAPRSVTRRNIAPRRTHLEPPEDAVNHAAMVGIGMTTHRVGWKMGLEHVPLGVGEVGPV